MNYEIHSIELPSGATLEVQAAPFSDAKALYQALLKEAKSLKVDESTDLGLGFFKDIFCSALSSPEIEKAIDKCLKKALYKKLPIGPQTFESVESRQDYLLVLWETAQVNILPFLPASLLQKFKEVLASAKATSSPKSE